ncbi:MAG: 6-phospho-3-hexuloisomerase, partial [Methanomicrobiales archaeon]|nr:6-phospho-3-hexuloisomerase [Methanomicrobiales archaeon]
MMKLMAATISSTATSLSNESVGQFIDELVGAERIYVMGAGRSGLVAKGFAMRLMHLGMHSYVVGETITPA